MEKVLLAVQRMEKINRLTAAGSSSFSCCFFSYRLLNNTPSQNIMASNNNQFIIPRDFGGLPWMGVFHVAAGRWWLVLEHP